MTLEKDLILILDFGSQYTQLIARRVRELNVYCEIFPYDASIKKINCASFSKSSIDGFYYVSCLSIIVSATLFLI